MAETYRYLGSVAGPDSKRNITAAFNGPIILGPGGEINILPRLMDRIQRPGVTDQTTGFGVYEVKIGLSCESKLVKTIPVSTLQGPHKDLNLEDIRSRLQADGTYLLGATATTREGVPYPAILRCRPPFGPQDFSRMQVLENLPAGKNVLPLEKGVCVYRREAPEFDRVLTFVNILTGTIIREVELPETPLTQNGRYGLTGGSRVWLEDGKRFRMLLHGFRRNPDDNSVVYSLMYATVTDQEDGTFVPVKYNPVDHVPALTYEQVSLEMGSGTRPDPTKKVIYCVGTHVSPKGKMLVPVTFDDQRIGLFLLRADT